MLIEILLHIELENIDYVAARIKSFKRRYKKYLSVIDDGNPVVYLQFIEHYLNNPQDTTTDKFKQKVEASFSWENEAAFDVFQIAFYAWLKAKMENISLYDMTLQLVNN